MLIRSIRVNNLLSFGPDFPPLELGPLSVLIGPNGAGKSNLIEVISLLRAAPKSLQDRIRSGGGMSEWFWKGKPFSLSAVIETAIEVSDVKIPLLYYLEVLPLINRLGVVQERIVDGTAHPGQPEPDFYYRYDGRQGILNVGGYRRVIPKQDMDPDESVLSQRKDSGQYPEITLLGCEFSRIRLYREWSFGRGAPARFPQRADLSQ